MALEVAGSNPVAHPCSACSACTPTGRPGWLARCVCSMSHGALDGPCRSTDLPLVSRPFDTRTGSEEPARGGVDTPTVAGYNASSARDVAQHPRPGGCFLKRWCEWRVGLETRVSLLAFQRGIKVNFRTQQSAERSRPAFQSQTVLGSAWPTRVSKLFADYGEFDPGSGRTLAACLTHASRARKSPSGDE